MKDTLPVRVQFGVFELDLRSGEVRQAGRVIRLQEKAFRLLQILIEHDGDLVSRDEIQKKLWPNDTIVDFEHGINSTIKRLRQALDDSAVRPRYIETIPRRGYRLLVPVRRVSTDRSSGGSSSDAAGTVVRSGPNSSLIGKKVSHYRVLEVIGGGGMGMVYKAEDLKLGRQVALKFLPDEVAWDEVALRRFQREARTASSLDHPNICTIYEVEEHDEQPFIVMQLLEGETLRDRLAAVAAGQKTLPLVEALDFAVQICAGLQAAHDKGIIHRDIKPANIFIGSTGQVKILDFGLAKLVSKGQDPGNDCFELEGGRADQATPQGVKPFEVDATLTRIGAAMGTAGYMSPEQVRGEKLDTRTDLFSSGLVLYEMATGQRAFRGDTAAVVREAILNHTPTPAHEVKSGLPSQLEAIIVQALEKNREIRYQSAAELCMALEETRRIAAVPSGGSTRLRRIAVASLVFLLAAASLLGLWWRHRPLVRYVFETYRMTSLTATGNVAYASVSPNGKYLAYGDDDAGGQSLWLKQLATSTTVTAVGPISHGLTGGVQFSADSNFLYYRPTTPTWTQNLYRLPVTGGVPRLTISNVDSSVDLSPDGKQIVFIRQNTAPAKNDLLISNADGSAERLLLTLKGTELLGLPVWAPDGETIAFGIDEAGTGMVNCIAVISRKGGRERRIVRNVELSGLAWLPDQSGLVMAVNSLAGENSTIQVVSYPEGKLRRITSDLSDYVGVSLTQGARQLVTVQKQLESTLWVAPALNPSQAMPMRGGTGKKDGMRGVTWTPEDRLIYGTGNQGELWLVERDGSTRQQLTNTDNTASHPSSTQAGSVVVFSRVDPSSNTWNIWAINTDGSDLRQVTTGAPSKWEPEISPDGTWITYYSGRAPWKMSLKGGEPKKLGSEKGYAAISPDGKWIAFEHCICAGATPQLEIVAADGKGPPRFLPFIFEPQVPFSTDIWGIPLRWTAAGDAITYVRTQHGVSNIWRQPIDGSPARQLTNFTSLLIWYHDWSRDGKYLVMARGNFSRDAVMLTDLR